MSNNSFPCDGGGEIGRSQVTQARACGLAPETAMNPVLLKPCGESRSQVIVHGNVWRTLDAREYYEHVPYLRQCALDAYEDLAARFDVVVMEGAGSVAELNLVGRDFVNLSMARAVGARALLVADIERGGVFASILGTLDLLDAEDRSLVHCFAVNRFRGDRSLFDDGVRILERRSGIACLGVFPFTQEILLDAEDSLSDSHKGMPLNVAIVSFPRISNTTDFRFLGGATKVDWPVHKQFDFVILPGTKSTMADLAWLRARGLDEWVRNQYAAGAHIIGICGGYQMLGDSIRDPHGVDGPQGECAGLGLIRAHTVMSAEKTTVARSALTSGGSAFQGYEIHMGRTEIEPGLRPFAVVEDGSHEGVRDGLITGTYLHGALESPDVFHEIFGFAPLSEGSPDQELDALGRWLELYSDAGVLSRLIE